MNFDENCHNCKKEECQGCRVPKNEEEKGTSIKHLMKKSGEEDLDGESSTKNYYQLRVTWSNKVATTRSLLYLSKALAVKRELKDLKLTATIESALQTANVSYNAWCPKSTCNKLP